jgi:hypothetical protein
VERGPCVLRRLEHKEIVAKSRGVFDACPVAREIQMAMAVDQSGQQRALAEIQSLRGLRAWHGCISSNGDDPFAIDQHSRIVERRFCGPIE